MIVATLDTGALIALERQKPRGMMLLRAVREHRTRLHVITPVLSEWWRGRTDVRDRIQTAVTLVPFPVRSAQVAGVALGKMRGPKQMSVDVMVMAYAATFGGSLVYSSDVEDLQMISQFFPDVRVLGV